MKSSSAYAVAVLLLPILSGCGGTGGSGGSNVRGTLTVDLNGNAITMAAFQDGVGTWVPITAGTNGKLSHSVTDSGGRFSVMVVLNTTPKSIQVWSGTIAEINSIVIPLDTPTPSQMTVSGSVSNLPAGKRVWIAGADASQLLVTKNSSYTLQMTALEPWEFVARYQTAAGVPTGYLVRRGLKKTDLTQDVDVTASEFKPPVPFAVTVAIGAGVSNMSSGVTLFTPGGAEQSLGSSISNSFTYYGLDASQRSANDLYLSGVTCNAGAAQQSYHTEYHVTPTDLSFAAPSPPAPATVSLLNTGTTSLLSVTSTVEPTAKIFLFTYSNPSVYYSLYETTSRIGPGNSKTMTMPDFTSLKGWDSSWNTTTLTGGTWLFEATATSLDYASWMNSTPIVFDGEWYTVWDSNSPAAPAFGGTNSELSTASNVHAPYRFFSRGQLAMRKLTGTRR